MLKEKAKAQLLNWLGIKEIFVHYEQLHSIEPQPFMVEIEGAMLPTYQSVDRKYMSLLKDIERLKTKITILGICQIIVSLSFIVVYLKLS